MGITKILLLVLRKIISGKVLDLGRWVRILILIERGCLIEEVL